MNSLEMAGDPTLVLDPPSVIYVAYYVPRRDQFVPVVADNACYRLTPSESS